jgi:mono/diheme cytochrome c family protein
VPENRQPGDCCNHGKRSVKGVAVAGMRDLLGVGLQISMIGDGFRPDFRHGRSVMRDIKRILRPVAGTDSDENSMLPRAIAMAGFVLAAASTLSVAQTIGPQNPPLIITSIVGRDSFKFYCASCHGGDGGGGGPAAAALKTPPPDLRLLANRNAGVFPRGRVLDHVTNGGDVAAHGSSEMPIWGLAFKGLDRSDTLVTIRIKNIVDYLESIQVK